MNVLAIFDQRIGNIFIEGAPGQRQPFSFKRLAKRAVREMEDETFVIDGVDTAPALYTVLVSAEDDDLMRHMYINITDEISQLIEAQAKKRGYTFVGRPLVRFMIDPSLRPGKFSIFAENIDPRTLARLRDEENAYLGIASYAQEYQEPEYQSGSVLEQGPQGGEQPMAEAYPDAPSADSDPLDIPVSDSLESEGPLMEAPIWPEESAVAQPGTSLAPGTCVLINMQTKQSFQVVMPRAAIGRVRTDGGVVLRDPNVSRTHAELVFDGSKWSVRDLNSTNGTLVNGVDVSESVLHNGDVLTIGLTDLEFQAG